MSTAAEERLEIRDNGSFLGWADVTNGKWSFSPTGLSVGAHTLTALYKGTTSEAWTLNVESRVDLETFSNAPIAFYRTLDLSYFTARLLVGNIPLPPLPAPRDFAGTCIIDNPHLQGRCLSVAVARNNLSNLGVALARIDFKTPYSVISFTCYARNGVAANKFFTSKIEAVGVDGKAFITEHTSGWGASAVRTVSMGTQGGKLIQALTIEIGSPTDVSSAIYIDIDNLSMRR